MVSEQELLVALDKLDAAGPVPTSTLASKLDAQVSEVREQLETMRAAGTVVDVEHDDDVEWRATVAPRLAPDAEADAEAAARENAITLDEYAEESA